MSEAIIEAAARALMIADAHLTQANAERVATAFTPIIEAAVTPLIRAAVLERAAKALAPFARAADVYHEERFAPDDEITGRFGEIVKARELWRLRNLYTRLRARALKPAPEAVKER